MEMGERMGVGAMARGKETPAILYGFGFSSRWASIVCLSRLVLRVAVSFSVCTSAWIDAPEACVSNSGAAARASEHHTGGALLWGVASSCGAVAAAVGGVSGGGGVAADSEDGAAGIAFISM